MKEQIAKLKSLLSKLQPGDIKFAGNLIYGFEKYGKLTVGQTPWVAKLIERAEQGVPEVKSIDLGSVAGIIQLFKTAQEHLKYPKIILLAAGKKVVLAVSGPTSKTPGWVNAMGEGSFPDREWFGKISPQGQWQPSIKLSNTPELQTTIQSLLVEFSKDPAGVAQKYGKLTGACCFCNSKLTDPKSTAAGFGKICASHYGLSLQWETAWKNAPSPGGEVMKYNPTLVMHVKADAYAESVVVGEENEVPWELPVEKPTRSMSEEWDLLLQEEIK